RTSSSSGATSSSSSSTSSSGTATGSSSSSSSGSVVDAGGDATPAGELLFGFDGPDAGLGCWAIQPYGTPLDTVNYPKTDAGRDAGTPVTIGDAGASLYPVGGYYYLSSFSTLSVDPAVGNPPGSLEVQVPFDGFNQQALFDCNLATPKDMSGKILSVQVKVDSGFVAAANAPGGFVLAVKSGTAYAYAQKPYTNLPANATWVQFDFDLSNPDPQSVATGFDPSMIVAIELHFDTGAGVAGAAPPVPAVFHVDNVTLHE
ncbi:MAG: hypothetical protein JOZ69_24480, partial [Myxococcales bacterium]|nr:hypothetical protein [Myxococcales bacterium]